MDEARAKRLTKMGDHRNATVYQGDCNECYCKKFSLNADMKIFGVPYACWTHMDLIPIGK